MATKTAVAAQPNQARITTDGTVIARYQSYSATMTNGDVVLFNSIPVPHGAHVTSFQVDGVIVATVTASVSTVFTTGFAYSGSTDYNTVGSSATISKTWKGMTETMTNAALTAGATTRWPLTISVSDDYAPRYVVPKVTLAGAIPASAAGVVKMVIRVEYSMDP